MCAFGVSSSKLLGFIILRRGIEADPKKNLAIIDFPPLRNLKYMICIQGKVFKQHRWDLGTSVRLRLY